jgi:hypothetical protein
LSYYNDLVPDWVIRERFPGNAAIEIQLWEAHVNDHHGINGRFLVTQSVDGAPAPTQSFSIGRVTYRFAYDAWFNDVKPFLIQNRIPVSMRFVRIESTSEPVPKQKLFISERAHKKYY